MFHVCTCTQLEFFVDFDNYLLLLPYRFLEQQIQTKVNISFQNLKIRLFQFCVGFKCKVYKHYNVNSNAGTNMAVSERNRSESLIGRDETGEEYETSEDFWSLQDEREWYKILDEYWKLNNNKLSLMPKLIPIG